jgi:hypothetical protein
LVTSLRFKQETPSTDLSDGLLYQTVEHLFNNKSVPFWIPQLARCPCQHSQTLLSAFKSESTALLSKELLRTPRDGDSTLRFHTHQVLLSPLLPLKWVTSEPSLNLLETTLAFLWLGIPSRLGSSTITSVTSSFMNSTGIKELSKLTGNSLTPLLQLSTLLIQKLSHSTPREIRENWENSVSRLPLEIVAEQDPSRESYLWDLLKFLNKWTSLPPPIAATCRSTGLYQTMAVTQSSTIACQFNSSMDNSWTSDNFALHHLRHAQTTLAHALFLWNNSKHTPTTSKMVNPSLCKVMPPTLMEMVLSLLQTLMEWPCRANLLSCNPQDSFQRLRLPLLLLGLPSLDRTPRETMLTFTFSNGMRDQQLTILSLLVNSPTQAPRSTWLLLWSRAISSRLKLATHVEWACLLRSCLSNSPLYHLRWFLSTLRPSTVALELTGTHQALEVLLLNSTTLK